MKHILLTFILSFITSSGFAQVQKTQKFLQQNADSTIIFRLTSNWISDPLTYFVASKKSDTITLYKYGMTNDRKINMPIKMRDTLRKLNEIPYEQIGGINKDFNAVATTDQEAIRFWDAIAKHNPWAIADDKVDGEGCPQNHKNAWNVIYDGGGIQLILITKNQIKKLDFYAPAFYDKNCPGRKGRKAILKIQKIFASKFGVLY